MSCYSDCGHIEHNETRKKVNRLHRDKDHLNRVSAVAHSMSIVYQSLLCYMSASEVSMLGTRKVTALLLYLWVCFNVLYLYIGMRFVTSIETRRF